MIKLTSAHSIASILDLVEIWRRRLHLDEWTIKISQEKPKGKRLAEIRFHRDKKVAYIRCSKKLLKGSFNRLEKVIVHELVHLVVDPMMEVHDLHLGLMPEEDQHDINKDFTEANETTVARLTSLFYNIYYKPS